LLTRKPTDCGIAVTSPFSPIAEAPMKRILLAAIFCLACVQPSAAKDAPGPEAVEFKLRLAPKMATAPNREQLWKAIGGNGATASQKKCRLVQFLDVTGARIRKASFLLRHRTKLDSDDCSDPIPDDPKGDLTLKFRTADAQRATAEREAAWAKIGDRKFEQDVTCSAGAAGGACLERAYSLSAKVDDAKSPHTVGGLRDVYPNALGSLAKDAKLDPGCRRVFEERWVLEPEASTGLPDEIELAVWIRVSKSGKKTGEPLVAELSFKADLGKPNAEHDADALLARLIRTLDPSWLAPGSSKTAEAYDCDHQ